MDKLCSFGNPSIFHRHPANSHGQRRNLKPGNGTSVLQGVRVRFNKNVKNKSNYSEPMRVSMDSFPCASLLEATHISRPEPKEPTKGGDKCTD